MILIDGMNEGDKVLVICAQHIAYDERGSVIEVRKDVSGVYCRIKMDCSDENRKERVYQLMESDLLKINDL